MLDVAARKLIDPPLNTAADAIAAYPISANAMTLFGFGMGIMACVFMLFHFHILALIFLIINRLCDGLDGAIARARGEQSDFGGYLDIVLDFVIYAGFPMMAAIGHFDYVPLLAGVFVLFSIVTTGVSFLAYAILCAKRGIETTQQGSKTFYFSNGLMEGTETIIFMVLLCLLPSYFTFLCLLFGVLCLATTALRVRMAYQVFK